MCVTFQVTSISISAEIAGVRRSFVLTSLIMTRICRAVGEQARGVEAEARARCVHAYSATHSCSFAHVNSYTYIVQALNATPSSQGSSRRQAGNPRCMSLWQTLSRGGRMRTVLMIERHMLQMMLYNMLGNLLCNHSEMLHNTKGVI
jgi:hypothetical protein